MGLEGASRSAGWGLGGIGTASGPTQSFVGLRVFFLFEG